MTSAELPSSVLPTPVAGGGFEPPEKVFNVTTLEPLDLRLLRRFVGWIVQTNSKDPNLLTSNIRGADMVEAFPWLHSWSQVADNFLLEHGSSFTPPISPDDGFTIKLFANRPSEDHMDVPRLWPAALSIGLLGTRELVGIRQLTPEAAVELAARLLLEGKLLKDFEEIDGVPVERIIQGPGDVVTIGNFATLHSGSPRENNVALAIASINHQEGPHPQYVIDHYNQFYPGSM